jgi:hypothetical protein
MAAVTVGTLHPVSPPGYEVNDKGQAAVAITKGQLLIITTTTPNAGFEKVWALTTTSTTAAHGIALMDAAAGAVVSRWHSRRDGRLHRTDGRRGALSQRLGCWRHRHHGAGVLRRRHHARRLRPSRSTNPRRVDDAHSLQLRLGG